MNNFDAAETLTDNNFVFDGQMWFRDGNGFRDEVELEQGGSTRYSAYFDRYNNNGQQIKHAEFDLTDRSGVNQLLQTVC